MRHTNSPTGEASAGEDDIHLSWWPTATQWDKSSGNQGYWTPHNEIWFQRRLDAIRSGDHRPLGSKHWKNNIAFHKASTPVDRAHERYCLRTLDELFPTQRDPEDLE